MMKKIISLFLVFLIMSALVFAIPVMATEVPDELKLDYIPGGDGNLIKMWPTSGNLSINAGGVSATASGTTATIKATADFTDSNTTWGIKGFLIDSLFNSSWSNSTAKPNFAKGTKVLFGAKLRNAEGTTSSKINNVFVRTSNATIIWSDAYPTENDGFTVAGNDWIDFKTVSTVSMEFGTSRIPIIGFSKGATKDTQIEIDMSTMYYGEEAAHDIEVTADSTMLSSGASTTVKARILNQLDDTYSGTQGDFVWYALSDDRKSFADGITVTPNGDGTASVTVGLSTPTGKYDIVAVSDTYEGFVKGTTINVVKVADYIPGEMPENIIADAATAFGTTGNSASVRWSSTDEYVMLEAMNDLPDIGETWPYHGATVSGEGLIKSEFSGGTNLVFSAQVKKLSNQGSVSVGAGLFRSGRVSLYPNEFTSDSEGMEINEAGWKTFAVSYTIPKDSSVFIYDRYAFPVIGMVEGTPEGSKIAISKKSGSMYLGVEEIYDITNEAVDTCVVDAGKESTVTYKAQIVNQVGLPGTIEQGAFKWFAMNEDKTAFVNGIKITQNADNTATIKVSEDTPAGVYKIVAMSEMYPEFVRSCQLVVTDGNIMHSIYVSPDGNDENEGTFTSPLKTVQAAQKLARLYKKQGKIPLEVVFREGNYYFEESLEFYAEDSGQDGYPIVYRAYENESVKFKGSKQLDLTKARKVTDESILARIRDGFKSEVRVIDLAEQGITQSQICKPAEGSVLLKLDYHKEFNGFYINGRSQEVSCWPNGGDEAPYTYNSEDSINKFTYTDSAPDRWGQAKNWWINIFNMYDFIPVRLKASSVDTVNNIIYTGSNGGKLQVNIANPYTPTWKAYNLLEEIDIPGEYHIDVENMKLYFLPDCDLTGATAEIDVIGNPVITLQETQNVIFRGIEFSQINDDGIVMTDVNNVDVEKCIFRDIGFRGLAVVGTQEPKTVQYTTGDKFPYGGSVDEVSTANDASYNMNIKDNIFYNTGSSAIHINGGNIDTLTPSNNIVENNFISKFSQNVWWDGVVVIGVGIKVRNNNISDSHYYAIRSYGNDHIIEYNEIYDVIKNTNDAAAIYSGASYIGRGALIQYNYLHHLKTWKETKNDWEIGIYFDDCQQGHTARYNIITDVNTGFNSNGAGDYVLEGNTVVNTSCGASFAYNKGAVPDKETRAVVEQCIYDKELYYSKYSALKDLVDGVNPKKSSKIMGNIFGNVEKDFIFADYRIPGGNTIKLFHQENDATFSENKTADMSVFVNPENGDYRVKSEYALNYPYVLNESFDIEKIGKTTNLMLNKSTSPFALIYPANKAMGINKDELWLSWEDAFGASKYRLTVAKNSDFSTLVYDDIVPYNTFNLSGVAELSVNTTYYWKVTAINPSRDFGAEWQSDVYSFTTTGTDITNLVFANGKLSAQITTCGGNIPSGVEATAYIASYDDNGKLLEVVPQRITLIENEPYPFEEQFVNYIKEKTYTVKMYLWDIQGKPLSSAAVYLVH